MLNRRSALAVLCAAVLLAACGDQATPPPAAPSPASPAADTVAIDLNVLTPAGTRGAGTATPVVGIVTSVSGTCPDLTFVLSGVTIHLGARTRFEGGACGDVKEGMRAGAIGVNRPDGSIDAARLRVGTPPPPPVAGLVESLRGSCPALTFVLDAVTVHTSGATVFDGGTCADLREGMRAAAIGRRTGDRTLEAEHVKFAQRPAPPPPSPRPPQPPDDRASVGGIVRSVSGTCPALTFAIDRTTVHASARTVFEGGSCADVRADIRAGAAGARRADGSIDAERVRMGTR
jgi:hypothetical protein